eukprot:Gb_01188 [translate_table: standard]
MLNRKNLSSTGQVGDGREKALLDYVLETAKKGNAQSVINAIDGYANTKGTWFMNIGDDKGPILDLALHKFNPRVVLEIGTYCGYSAVRIASQLHTPNSKLIALEMSPANCEITRKVVEHAGLSSKVQHFDFVFLDHWKDRYLPDYLVLKENGMLGNGSGICADNMGPILGPGDFKKYVKTHPEELETVEHKSNAEYLGWIPDSVTVSTYKLATP